MSRKGKLPIALPKGVELKFDGKKVVVQGPKGILETPVLPMINIVQEGEEIIVSLKEGCEQHSNFHGLYRTLVQNMVLGVSEGFVKRLTMIGVGYRAAVQGDLIDLQIGVSHPVKVQIPEGLAVTVEKNTTIVVSGCDKQKVGQFAADIRAKRKPEPYKGKGIRYEDEHVRKKAGKAAAKG